jgi:large subunit ribosomal protein L25
MELVKVVATARKTQGKSEAKRLRATGQIPAVAYGKGEAAVALAVSPKEIVGVLGRPLGRNSPIELSVEGGEKLTVLLRDFQYHPLSRDLLHADFLKINLDQPVDVDVPLELTGKAKGVVDGGVLRQVYRKLPLRCLPKDIPVKLEHDMTLIEIDQSVLVSELAIPAGVTVLLPPDQTVAAVSTEKKQPDEDELAAAAAAAAAAAPGAPGAPGAAAPGAPGAAPAPDKPEK